MNKTQIKHAAQDEIMVQMANTLISFQNSTTAEDATPEEKAMIEAEIQNQANRIAKLFGFESFTFN